MQLFGHGTTSSDLRQQKGSETQAVETTAESFSDTESSESGESSLKLSDFAYTVRGGGANPWTFPPHDQDDDDSADSDSFSGVYTSFDDETTDPRTSLYISDSERQRLLSNNLQLIVAELENRYRDDMQAHAVKAQMLRDAQEALTKELTRTFESREHDLLREKAELQTRLDEVSGANATLSAESARLSLEVDNLSHQVQEMQVRITEVEQDYTDILHQVQSLQKTEARSKEDVSCLTVALDNALADAVRLRQELDELNTSASQDHSNLLDANNTLRSRLGDATQELEMERMRSRTAATRSAEETLILTESRDSARSDLEQVCRERDELMNNVYLELERERAETSRLSEEIRSLHQDRDDAYANEKKETQTLSSLHAVEGKEQYISIVQAELATTQRDAELSCTLLTEDISDLEMERNALQVTVTMPEEEARDAQRQKDSDLQALRDEHNALLLRQTDKVRAEMQTAINVLQTSLNAQIDEYSCQLRASERSKEREIGSLRRERDELQRDLGATSTGRDQMSSDIRDLQAQLNESQIKWDESKLDILEESALGGNESELSNI
ncbi:hypothetical protein BDP27DRAFT_1362571 [Rhodocollybia butyracea]|uniref:Uncharacterized protein n=1 Tax=Rhodocollybia butyracea TaxID=206335 RepID=A0A9P5U9Y5_9AGAR|nr:hypothetical protein BDP27DRAFT_1362571 [Rhodocollybia butyracea]